MDNIIHFRTARRETQRAELDRRSGMERRIRLDAAMTTLREQRSWDDRRTEARRDADNAFVAGWERVFHMARARAK